MTSLDKTQIAVDGDAQVARAAVLLNIADELLNRPADELDYDVREKAYYLTVIADTRILLARELRERQVNESPPHGDSKFI